MLKKTSLALVGGSALALLFATAGRSAEETLAYWNFDAGSSGTPLAERPAEDLSGHGFLLHGYDNVVGPSYSSNTAAGSGLSCQTTAPQDGYTTDESLNNWSPSAWTIEVSVRFNRIDGWTTIIGRDGSSWPDIPKSDFYLQKNGVDDRLRLDFATADGSRYQLESPYPIAANAWYNIAAVSDGQNASLYVDRNDGKGYQLADSTALTGTNRALASSGANWTFGRGWYAGKYADNVDGYMDDIRFTAGALSPARFLHAAPAPAAMPTPAPALASAPAPQAPVTNHPPVIETPPSHVQAPAALPVSAPVRTWKGPRHQRRTF